MEFYNMGEHKLKVILTLEDMEELGIAYGDLDYSYPDTRKAMLLLLEQGKAVTEFRPRKAKIYIEAYPCEEGGCVLYFTSVVAPGPTGSGIEPVLFAFDNADDLTEAACKVFQRYSHRIYKSSLYGWEGGYRMVVYPLDYADRLSVYFLSEYGRKVGEGKLLAAYTEEYGHELIRDSAIDTLAHYFADPADPKKMN